MQVRLIIHNKMEKADMGYRFYTSQKQLASFLFFFSFGILSCLAIYDRLFIYC